MDKKLVEWHFDFGLCATKSDRLVSTSDCEELLEIIVTWAERHGFGIGGGYREFAAAETRPYPVDATDESDGIDA